MHRRRMLLWLVSGLIGSLLLTACSQFGRWAFFDDLRPPRSQPAPSEPADQPSQDSGPPPTEPAGGEPDTGDLPTVPGHTWELVDDDQFDGAELDETKWTRYRPLATNGVSRWEPDNVTVADGELRIIGRGKNPSGEGNEAGGLCWCNGNGDQTYGMWRVRAKLEPSLGYGQVFLLWPESGNWPIDGELDFGEVPNAAKDEVHGVVHWGASNEQDSATHRADLTQWRTYTVVWRPGLVQYYLDDTLFYDSTTSDRDVEVPDGPMHLALQVEPGPFGDNWVPPPGPETPDEVVTRIDWVELYR